MSTATSVIDVGVRRRRKVSARSWAPLFSVLLLVVIWQVGSFLTPLVPAPLAVLRQIVADAGSYPANIAQTMSTAGLGYLWGNGVAIVLALLTLPFPRVQALLERVAVGAIALPLIAVAPILVIVFSDNVPGIILSAQAVVFTTLVAVILGLGNVDQSALDLVHAAGGSSWTAIWKVRLPAAIPSLVVGLQIAAPSAILGAIIGEYMGGSKGLGVAMIQAQGAFDVPRAWALALVTSALAAIAFLAIPLIVRWTMPWVGHASSTIAARAVVRRARRLPWPLALGRVLLSILGTVLVVVVAWWGLAAAVPGGELVAKGPFQVIQIGRAHV